MFRVTKKIVDAISGYYGSQPTNHENKNIQTLPVEMIHQIFPYLNDSDLLNLSMTSVTFASMTSSYHEWQKFNDMWGTSVELSNKQQYFFFKNNAIKQKAALLADIFTKGMPGFVPGYSWGFGGPEDNFSCKENVPPYLRDTIFKDITIYPCTIIRYAIKHHGITHTSHFNQDFSESTLLHFIASAGLFDVLNAYLSEFHTDINIHAKNADGDTAFSLAYDNLINELFNNGQVNPEDNSSIKTVMTLLRHGARFEEKHLPPKSVIWEFLDIPDEDNIEIENNSNSKWRELFKLMLQNGLDKERFIQAFPEEYNNNKEFYDGVESEMENKIKINL